MSELDEEKKFYERFNALVSDRDLMRVFEQFGFEGFRRSSVLEGFESFIKAQGLRGRRCVEIGTLKGLTACVLARYFDEVVTIDIAHDPLRDAVLRTFGARGVVPIVVRNNVRKADIIRSLADFDCAYVDGDHARDTESDFALVRRCGRVLFHEHWDAQPAVKNLVQSLSAGGQIVTTGKWALWTV